jgi:hypothetical protein
MWRVLKVRGKNIIRRFASNQQKENKPDPSVESPQPITKDTFDITIPLNTKPPKPREFTVFLNKTSHIIPGTLDLNLIAFTLSFRRNLELDEYKAQAKYFLDAGVDHYLAKIDKNMGPKFIEYLSHFYKRSDLECTPW